MKKILCLILCLVSLLSLTLIACDDSNTDNIGDDNSLTPTQNPGITLTKTSLIGLPGYSYDVEFINDTAYQPIIEVSDYELVNVSVKSLSKISISLLKEGDGYVKVGTSHSDMKTINVKSLDLKITNEEDHIDVGGTLKITLSKDVDAAYSIDNTEIANVENGTIKVLKQGEFTLEVIYGDIILKKSFSSYVRSNTITNLDRNSIYVKYHGRNVHLGREVKIGRASCRERVCQLV